VGTDGSFSFDLVVPATAAAMTAPAVFTIRNHVDMADRTQDAKAAIAFAPKVPTLTVSPATNLNRAGATVTVSGVNYDPAKSIYVAICEDRALNTVSFTMFYSCVGARQVSPTPTTTTQVKMGTDGSFSFDLVVPATAAAMTAPAVFTIRNHVDMADRTQDAKFGIAFAPKVPTITVTPSTGLDRAGATVTVSGTNYDPTKTLYVAVCEDRALNTVTFAMFYGCVGARSVSPNPSSSTVVQMGTDGSFSFSLAVPASAAAFTAPAVFTIRNHVDQADSSQDSKAAIAFAAVTTPTIPGIPEIPTTPTTPTTPATPSIALSVSPSSVNPAVATAFTITGSGYTGAGAANGVYVSIGNASVWQPGQVPSQTEWLSTVWVQPSSVVNGGFSTTITIPAGSFIAGQSYGVATFAAHGLSITDRSLDAWSPISLSSTSTASNVQAPTVTTPPATPPATSGVETTSTSPTEGGEVTVTASGFQPNETGILVVIYSTPTILDRNATADANGVVTWTGILPRGLTGEHTLTLQGSVSRGVVLDIAAAEQVGCPVDTASLTWGFKESFRSYISGSIANGEWTVADGATYEVPNFGWSDGTGSYDAEGGLVEFAGSVNFTGHGGVLNTTIANPQISFVDENTAILILDISGTTQDGAAVDQQDVEFVEIDLSGAVEEADGTITVTDAPTTLTAAGAAAFGTYPEGEAFDAISLTIAAECATATAVEATDTSEVSAETTSSSADLTWLWILIVAVLLLIAAAVVIVVVRRRTAQ